MQMKLNYTPQAPIAECLDLCEQSSHHGGSQNQARRRARARRVLHGRAVDHRQGGAWTSEGPRPGDDDPHKEEITRTEVTAMAGCCTNEAGDPRQMRQ